MTVLNTMIVKSKRIGVALALSLTMMSAIAVAADYKPDIREFTAENSLSFSGHPAFDISDGATLEFWVAAGWTATLEYDPVVLMSVGENEFLYVVSILGDRSGISLQFGDEASTLDYDFTDDQLHHVALVNLGNRVVTMVDGRVIGQFNTKIGSFEASELWLGNSNIQAHPFIGALGGLRFWGTILEPESLVEFALIDVSDLEAPHPDLDFLKGQSELQNETINTFDEAVVFVDEELPDEDGLFDEEAPSVLENE